MRTLPQAKNLQEAVKAVIQSNTSDGHPFPRFVLLTKNGCAPDLFKVCDRIITQGKTRDLLETALGKFPSLLTLEDIVAKRGTDWGFSESTIAIAKARANYLDKLVRFKRYA